ncbi:MAG: GAF domain-containing protein [Spirochaetales bacterium]|nr:GAF domain-containing protein [Spirochaetales bacterium]
MLNKKKSRMRFRLSLIIANALVIMILTVGIIFIVFTTSIKTARYNVDTLFSEIGGRVEEKIGNSMNSLLNVASFGAVVVDSDEEITGDGQSHQILPFMRQSLDQDPMLYSLYYGKSDGTFLQLINARGNGAVIESHDAPGETWYILRSIELLGNGRIQHWTFLGHDWRFLEQRNEISPDYDPRKRSWYENAILNENSIFSDAYIFHSLKQLGISGSKSISGKNGVFGVDMALSDLNLFVEAEKPSVDGGILLSDQNSRVLAATAGMEELFSSDFTPLSIVPESIITRIKSGQNIGGKNFLNHHTVWDDGKESSIDILLVSPLADFTGYLIDMQWTIALFSLALLLIVMTLSILIFRKLTSILLALAVDAERVKHFDFSGEIPEESFFMEFHQLAEGFHHMKLTIAERTEELDTAQKKLKKIVDLGIAMAVERDVNHLVELILQGAKEIANADGGSVYLKAGNEFLDFKVVLNDTLGFVQGGTSGNPITIPHVALFRSDGTPSHENVVTHTFHTGKTVNIVDAYNNTDFDFSGTKKFDAGNNYISHSFLTVPLKPRGGEVMGALQLINAKDLANGSIIGFSEEIQSFVEALSASAATSLYNWELLETQHRLFDSMIEFTAGAIDAKSQYTGGHCERVPKIALKLAEAADRLEDGPFADFKINSSEEWRELKISAWLHDCGKMTTPEFVVDKATKLETIVNRIHEIRTRFEVLLRDAEIEKYQFLLDGGEPKAAERLFSERAAALQDEFRFIADCNSGDKFMEEGDVERIKEIGAKKWVRHFDDKLGLSWEEQARKVKEEEFSLPCTEDLLADKPEHLIERVINPRLEYEKYGFTLSIPENLYNRGEIYNLSIQRGTLSSEERFKINEHVIQTIMMLQNLSLPPAMKNIPLYAGTHHETLKGTGYPLRLSHSSLPIPARIMAIADIFEALTASDRPYKKTKPLSVCLKILHSFKTDGHIDPHLFDLLLTSGVYREYSEEFLQPDQIDEVNVAELIG